MSVTFNQPIRVYKFNNSSNNGVIAPDNTGVVLCSQQNSFSGVNAAGLITTYGTGSASTTPDSVVIPAGAIITNFRLFETTAPSAFTGMVITVAVNGTTVGTITPTTTGGVISYAPTATAAVATLLSNVGTSDATVTYTVGTTSGVTGTLAGVLVVDYAARNYDGSITNVGQGYTNS
jgi:hypothetical protein